MAVIRVTFACQHPLTVPASGTTKPTCPRCGETRVQAVSSPPPRITAVGCPASGPYVQAQES